MGIWEITYSTDGAFFISASHDKLPMLRDGVTGDWIGTFEGHSGAVWSAKLNTDATRAVTGSADSSAKLWNSVTGECLHTFDHKRVVRTVDFSPDSTRIATGGYESVLRIFDANRVDVAPVTVDHPGGSRIKKAVWARDGRTLVTGDDAGTLRLWDAATMSVVREVNLVAGSANGLMDMEQSADGSVLTVAVGSSVVFVEAGDLRERIRHDLGRELETASLHPTNPRYFLAGGSDVWVRLYDLQTGREMVTQRGHHGRVHALRFSPAGTTYSSGADDATIRIWKFDEQEVLAKAAGEKERAAAPEVKPSAQPYVAPALSRSVAVAS